MEDTANSLHAASAPAVPGVPGVARGARSLLFLSVYLAYVALVIGLGQRLVILPLLHLLPARRTRIVRWWLRLQGLATLAQARVLAGVRVTIQGRIAREPCIVIMNHQSVLDIPIGVAVTPGPYPLIPTRDRYARGIPGISPLVRLARFPIVFQRAGARRQELRGLLAAADAVRQGERSLLIFPEGHRTRDGAIGPFMRSGLRLVLSRARRPVYCVVADGLWRSRTVADAALRFAGTSVRVMILGPFSPPAADTELDSFAGMLRERMITALASMRAPEGP